MRRRRGLTGLAVGTAVVLCLVLAAQADERGGDQRPEPPARLRMRGRLAEDFAYRLHDPGDVSKLRTTGWLEGKYTLSEAVSLRAAARGWYDAVFAATDRYPANVARDQETDVSLREAVLSVSRDALDVHLGRQQIVWGEAISVFVTDVVNPRDLREFILPEFTELRIPLWALDVSYRFGPALRVEGVWTPDVRVHKLPKQGAEFQFAPIEIRSANPVIRLPDDAEELSPARSEGGFRISALVDGWDASLIYYDEADKSPVFFRHRLPQAGGLDVIALEPRHPRLHIVGATLAKSLEPVVLRSEAALTIGKHYETTDPLDADGAVRRDTLDYLIGLDYTVFSRVDVGLQIAQKVLTGEATNLTRGAVEARVTTSTALRMNTGFLDDAVSATLLFVINANRADYRISAKVEWAMTGAVAVSVGADIFEGPRRTLYGQFDRNDRVYVTTMWRF
jgi:hypothetical protein